MKRSHKAAAIFAALTLGAAAAVLAHPGQGQMGGGNGPAMKGGLGMHAKAGMQQGMHGAGQQLMTPEERSALTEKMRSAKTPEERQKLAQETRTEMQKRAKEQGIALPEHRGPRAGAPSESQTHTH
jgi:hypothetical protein